MQQTSTPFSNHFKGQLISQEHISRELLAGGSIRISRYKVDDPRSLREWWHTVLRTNGKYPCYAIFLMLPSDKHATKYFQENIRELHYSSSEDCLILFLGSDFFYTVGLYQDWPLSTHDYWVEASTAYISQGESLQVANLFDIKLTEFPCIIFFTDIRSSNFAVISLQDLDEEKINWEVRHVFSIIHEAVKSHEDIIASIRLHSTFYKAQDHSEKLVQVTTSFIGKTIETVMEAWIKATIK